MNGDAFRACVEQVLSQKLYKWDVVVMNNLPTHKVSRIRTMIEETGGIIAECIEKFPTKKWRNYFAAAGYELN